MKIFTIFIKVIESIIKVSLIFSISVMTGVTLIEVIRRYFFGLSFPWAEELVRYLLIWVTFLGGSLAFKTGNLVFFDFLQNNVPSRFIKPLTLVVHWVSLVFITYIFYYSVKYTFSYEIYYRNSISLGISLTFVYLSIPIGFGLMIIFALNAYPFNSQTKRKDGSA